MRDGFAEVINSALAFTAQFSFLLSLFGALSIAPWIYRRASRLLAWLFPPPPPPPVVLESYYRRCYLCAGVGEHTTSFGDIVECEYCNGFGQVLGYRRVLT